MTHETLLYLSKVLMNTVLHHAPTSKEIENFDCLVNEHLSLYRNILSSQIIKLVGLSISTSVAEELLIFRKYGRKLLKYKHIYLTSSSTTS